MSNQVTSVKELSVKDLVTTGIFAAIYTALLFLGGVFFASNPVLTFLMPLGCALLPGPVFLLLLAKVPKRGAVSLIGILLGIIMFVTGMHWGMAGAFVFLGIAGDFIAGTGQYKNLKLNIFSYVLFTLSTVVTYAIFFLDRDRYLAYMLQQGTDPSYFETMVAMAQNWMLPGIIIGTVLCALISAFVGKKLLKKQFEKAGIGA